MDDQLTFTDHIASVSLSCRFALFNIRKNSPYLTQHATGLLVQTLVISHLDYCNALLTGLPECVVKPLEDGLEHSGVSGVQPTEEGTRHPATH